MTMRVAPEIKSTAAGEEASRAFEEFARAFEAFKETNESRLAQIETRLSGDAVAEEKLARIGDALDEHKRRLDRISLDARRPALAGAAADARDPAIAEHKAAFDLYVRAGEAAGLKRLEAKALSAGSGPDGGYLVPDTIEREVLRRLAAISPIRAIASVRTISGGLYKRAFSTTGVSAGWIGDTAARPQTNAATLAELAFPAMELYAQPAATQTLLDDAVVDVEQWIASEVETAFAEQEGAAFVNGDGVNKPKGFLASDTVDNGAWVWGKLGFVPTGNAGAFPAASPSDKLVDLASTSTSRAAAASTRVATRSTSSSTTRAIRTFATRSSARRTSSIGRARGKRGSSTP
jgi:HK97 family phage major capsid protein